MLKVSSAVRSTHTQDGSVLLNIHHGEVFCLNLVGSKILDLLQLGHDEAAIAAKISTDYGVSQDVATRDVREFLDALHKHHILQLT